MEDLIAPRRLWLTADFSEVVLEDDERAAFLLAGKGCVIPRKVITSDGPLEIVVPEELLVPDDELVEPKASGAAKPKKERKARTAKPKSDPDQPAADAADQAGEGDDTGDAGDGAAGDESPGS